MGSIYYTSPHLFTTHPLIYLLHITTSLHLFTTHYYFTPSIYYTSPHLFTTHYYFTPSIYPAESSNSFPINFASGAVAGSVASTITLPFDVLKTLKQIDMGERDIMEVKAGKSQGNIAIAKELIR